MILKNFRYKKNEYFIFCIKKKKKKEKAIVFCGVFCFTFNRIEKKNRVSEYGAPPYYAFNNAIF